MEIVATRATLAPTMTENIALFISHSPISLQRVAPQTRHTIASPCRFARPSSAACERAEHAAQELAAELGAEAARGAGDHRFDRALARAGAGPAGRPRADPAGV